MISVKNGMILVEDNFRRPNFEKMDGLVFTIVQEWAFDRRGRVLMTACVNEEAFRLTLETGFAHFWSRSRNKIWKKGETSGNVLVVREIFLDCDQDTLLYMVVPAGPVCHTGKIDCFTRKAHIGKL